MNPAPMPDEYYEQLEQIQSLDFVLVELTLYLDTHPDDWKAIEQYNQVAQQSKTLKSQFEAQFGPLKHFGESYSRYPWEWMKPPWPWQL